MRVITIMLLLTMFAAAEKKKTEVKADPVLLPIEKLVKARADRSGETLEWKSKDELHRKFINKFIAAPDFGASRVIRIDMDRI